MYDLLFSENEPRSSMDALLWRFYLNFNNGHTFIEIPTTWKQHLTSFGNVRYTPDYQILTTEGMETGISCMPCTGSIQAPKENFSLYVLDISSQIYWRIWRCRFVTNLGSGIRVISWSYVYHILSWIRGQTNVLFTFLCNTLTSSHHDRLSELCLGSLFGHIWRQPSVIFDDNPCVRIDRFRASGRYWCFQWNAVK